jgi:hypothetical protein
MCILYGDTIFTYTYEHVNVFYCFSVEFSFFLLFYDEICVEKKEIRRKEDMHIDVFFY